MWQKCFHNDKIMCDMKSVYSLLLYNILWWMSHCTSILHIWVHGPVVSPHSVTVKSWLLLKEPVHLSAVLLLHWREGLAVQIMQFISTSKSNPIEWCWTALCVCSCVLVFACLHVFVAMMYTCVCALNCNCLPACISPAGMLIVLQISPISIYNYSSWDWVFFL